MQQKIRRTILRINKKNFQDEALLHELFLITRQTTKISNVIVKIILTDIKLSKAQLSKMIQSAGFLCNMLGNLDKVKTDLAILFR